MSIQDYEVEAHALCARQSITFLSCEPLREENVLYVRAISRDQYGEVWRLDFNDEGEHNLSERVLRFSLFGEPTVPLCIIDDAARMHAYLRERTNAGLAVDPMDYTRPFGADS